MKILPKVIDKIILKLQEKTDIESEGDTISVVVAYWQDIDGNNILDIDGDPIEVT